MAANAGRLENDIESFSESGEQTASVNTLQVESDCALVPIERMPRQASLDSGNIIQKWLQPPSGRSARRLDHNDVGAKVGKDTSCQHRPR